jgi:ABC-2 type transport system permease protein
VLETQQAFARLSPGVLFNRSSPCCSIRRSGRPAVDARLIRTGVDRARAIPDAPIRSCEAFSSCGRRSSSLIAGTILLFVVGYIVFQRQEVRA